MALRIKCLHLYTAEVVYNPDNIAYKLVAKCVRCGYKTHNKNMYTRVTVFNESIMVL